MSTIDCTRNGKAAGDHARQVAVSHPTRRQVLVDHDEAGGTVCLHLGADHDGSADPSRVSVYAPATGRPELTVYNASADAVVKVVVMCPGVYLVDLGA